MSANASQMPRPSESRQDYGTPLDFRHAVERRFGPIRFDLAATLANRLHTDCFTERDDSLSKDWADVSQTLPYGSILWLNPPFANIGRWAHKCSTETGSSVWKPGTRILMLVPASIGAMWWHECVHPYAYVLALAPRLTFGGCKDPYPKDLALCVYGSCTGPGFAPWRWK